MDCTCFAASEFVDADTKVVGCPWITSSAWLGPDRVTTLVKLSPKTSVITSLTVIKVSISIPLETLTIVWVLLNKSLLDCNNSRMDWDGTAMITVSAPEIASSIDDVNATESGKIREGAK